MSQVLFHSDAFASASRYGLARYAWELYEALRALDASLELVPISSRCTIDEAERRKLRVEHGFVGIGWPHRLLLMQWMISGGPKIERWYPDADLVHTVEMDYPVTTRKPWVVTVHDLGPLTHPEYFSESRPWIRRRGIDAAIDRADIIVCVSGATAAAVEAVAGRSLDDRLRVIPEGVSDAFYDASDNTCLNALSDMPPAGTPYFLWTGSLNPRKNLHKVLDAFEMVAGELEESLVIAGGLGWDNGELLQRLATSCYRDRIHRPGFVSDDQLKALYRGASAFVYVSYMEGFGLPILEAMASGCPVITSNTSAMPEVAGNAGLLVDPSDSTAIGDAMLQLAGDTDLRSSLASAGLANARSFSWQKCAKAMQVIYDELS